MARRGLDKGKLTKEKRVLNSGFLQVQPKPTKDVRTLYNGLGLGKDPPAYALLFIFPIDIDLIAAISAIIAIVIINFIFQSFPFHLLWHAT